MRPDRMSGRIARPRQATIPVTTVAALLALTALATSAAANWPVAWGDRTGALGDGTHVQMWAPTRVVALDGVVGAAGGRQHSLLLRSDGTVWDRRVSVKRGTVLLEGYQMDTPARLAAASVPGVKEVVNMLVIRVL